MPPEPPDLDRLLLRCVSGKATPAERMEVEAWANSAPQNRVRLDQTRATWVASAPAKRDGVTRQEKESDWTTLMTRMRRSDCRRLDWGPAGVRPPVTGAP